MFLQITTLVVLAITLATRFATAKSTQGMQLEITELENDYSKLRTDYSKLFEARKAAEEQAKKLDAEIAANDSRRLEHLYYVLVPHLGETLTPRSL